jgi:integrase/recombinase XerD
MGLKFFFDVTLNRGGLMAKMQAVQMPRTRPVVLSHDGVVCLIAAAPNPKSKTALWIAYGTGLRASEVIASKVGDIDSERMMLRGKQARANQMYPAQPWLWARVLQPLTIRRGQKLTLHC